LRFLNSQQGNLFRDWFYYGLREQLAGAHVRFTPQSACAVQLGANNGHLSARVDGFRPEAVLGLGTLQHSAHFFSA
jgi:hypothetical protein